MLFQAWFDRKVGESIVRAEARRPKVLYVPDLALRWGLDSLADVRRITARPGFPAQPWLLYMGIRPVADTESRWRERDVEDWERRVLVRKGVRALLDEPKKEQPTITIKVDTSSVDAAIESVGKLKDAMEKAAPKAKRSR